MEGRGSVSPACAGFTAQNGGREDAAKTRGCGGDDGGRRSANRRTSDTFSVSTLFSLTGVIELDARGTRRTLLKATASKGAGGPRVRWAILNYGPARNKTSWCRIWELRTLPRARVGWAAYGKSDRAPRTAGRFADALAAYLAKTGPARPGRRAGGAARAGPRAGR